MRRLLMDISTWLLLTGVISPATATDDIRAPLPRDHLSHLRRTFQTENLEPLMMDTGRPYRPSRLSEMATALLERPWQYNTLAVTIGRLIDEEKKSVPPTRDRLRWTNGRRRSQKSRPKNAVRTSRPKFLRGGRYGDLARDPALSSGNTMSQLFSSRRRFRGQRKETADQLAKGRRRGRMTCWPSRPEGRLQGATLRTQWSRTNTIPRRPSDITSTLRLLPPAAETQSIDLGQSSTADELETERNPGAHKLNEGYTERQLLSDSVKMPGHHQDSDWADTGERPPIDGVKLIVEVDDKVVGSETITIEPAMSVYKVLYQAALLSDETDESEGFQFDVGRRTREGCPVISFMSGIPADASHQWLIAVQNSNDQIVYKGVCLPPVKSFVVLPGMTIFVSYNEIIEN